MDDRAADLAQQQRLITLVGCLHGIALEFDGEARYLNVWAEDPALLAAPAAEMIGRSIDDVLGHDVGARFSAAVRRVHATGKDEQFEYPLELGGVLRWFVADVKRVGSPSAEMTVLMLARDITEQRQVNEALSRSEERYRLAARATNDILWDHDLVAGTITWSASTKKLLGYDDALTSEAFWRERIHADDARRVVGGLEAALASDASAWSETYRFRRSDGSYGEFIDRAFIVRDAGGSPLRAVGSMIDVTELNRLQAQLLRADRLASLGVLAAGVGHEINNPLMYVSGNIAVALDAIAAAGPTDPTNGWRTEIVAALTEAREGTARISEIVKTLKMFSRVDDGKLGPVDVEAVLERAIKMTENEIRHRARLVRCFVRIPHVQGSESQLAQVFVNLLINAAQAMEEGEPEKNELRVTTGVDAEGRVFIAVADNGRGIAPEHLAHVFDPFFTTKDKSGGTGLGLSICDGIVRQLNGALEVKSEVGHGTTFTVRLAAANRVDVTAASSERIEDAVGTHRPHVLVIDDEPAVGRVIERILRADADVVVVPSAREGIARLAKQAFAIIFCDVMMPEMSGSEFHEWLAKERPELVARVYFMTGGAVTPKAKGFLDAIGEARLDKPIDPSRLRALVRAAPIVAPSDRSSAGVTSAKELVDDGPERFGTQVRAGRDDLPFTVDEDVERKRRPLEAGE